MCESDSSWFTIILRIRILNTASSVADPECLSLLPDQTFFYLRSRIQIFSIPDPHQSILTQKNCFLSSRIYDQGSSSMRILIFTHPGSRALKGTGSRMRPTDSLITKSR